MLTLNPSGRALEITCSGCGATNRVPVDRLKQRPVCGRCKDPLALDRPFAVSDATFDGLVGASALPVLVDFWAPWCGPCRTVAPELEQIARDRQGELLVAKLNSDENPRVSNRYGIRSIPTLALFRGGQEVKRLMGAMPARQILSSLPLG
jgi:thioredoxin 2